MGWEGGGRREGRRRGVGDGEEGISLEVRENGRTGKQRWDRRRYTRKDRMRKDGRKKA
jgi:hypothetical protein